MTIASHNSFAEALKNINITYRPDFVGCFDLVDRMRMQKQEVEIESLKRAIDITDQAFVRVLSVIRPGKTESEIAWEIEKSVRELGAESLAFDTIVGSGINGAIPHHATGDTLIASGEPIVIDMGARYQGYCADLTRTVFLGDPDDQFVKVYNTVRDAQASAIEGVKPGMTGADLDTISRQVIDKAGYGENFGHSLGHGVGLARNISRILRRQEPLPCRLINKGTLAPLGYRIGVAKVFGIKFSGFIAWWLWRTVYPLKMPGWGRKFRIALDGALDLFTRRDVVQLSLHTPERETQ